MNSLFQDRNLIEKLIVLGQQAETGQQQIYNTALQMIDNLKQNINSILSSKPLDGQALSSLEDLKEWFKTSNTTVNGIKIFEPVSATAERTVSRVDGFYIDGLTAFLQDLRDKADQAKDIRLAGMTENLIEDTNKAGLTKLPPKSEQTEAPKQEQPKPQQTTEPKPGQQAQPRATDHQKSQSAQGFPAPFDGNIFNLEKIRDLIHYLQKDLPGDAKITISRNVSSLRDLVDDVYTGAIHKTPGIEIIAVRSSSGVVDAVNALKGSFNSGKNTYDPATTYSSKELGGIGIILSNIAYQTGSMLQILKSFPEILEVLGENILNDQISKSENYVKLFRAANDTLMMEHRNAIR